MITRVTFKAPFKMENRYPPQTAALLEGGFSLCIFRNTALLGLQRPWSSPEQGLQETKKVHMEHSKTCPLEGGENFTDLHLF